MRIAIFLCLVLIGCKGPVSEYEAPPLRVVSSARIPVDLRQGNYGPSCYHASMITALRWQGQTKAAAWWRRNGYGPTSIYDVKSLAKRAGLKYRITTSGDVGFLEWVSRTRRAAAIQYQYRHAVTFAGFRGNTAIIIDNRWPRKEVRVPKQTFLRSWRSYGGHAITVLDQPPPPRPWR